LVASAFNPSRGLRQHRVELIELRLRGVVVHKSGGALHLADYR
jgi:hypothetical protein